MSSPRIIDLVDAASAAALDEAAAAARAAALKGAAVAEAERIRLEVGVADRFTSEQGLGVLRLDGANKPAAPFIQKPGELADYLAQRRPDLVTATVTVPADLLETALQALEFAGVEGATAEVLPKDAAATWLKEHCQVAADPDAQGGWYVRTVTATGTEVVPGVGAVKPSPRWVLAANQDLKRARAAQAQEEVRSEFPSPAGASVPDAPTAVAAASIPDQSVDPVTDLMASTHAELAAQCRSAGLPVSGTKATLASRLWEAVGA